MKVILRTIGALACSLLMVGLTSAEERMAGDPVRGEELYKSCIGCHEIGPGAVHTSGPHLNNIFDTPAGTIDGFKYSDDMVRAGIDGLVWTLESLDLIIEDTRILVSRSSMEFAGISEPQDRADILAYMRGFSAKPSDIPEASPRVHWTEHELDPVVLAIVGDPAYGEYLAGECSGCHQIDGDYDGIPSIVGWYPEDFVIALHAYKSERREHPVMQMLAKRLSDEEIAALAAYYEGL